MKKGASCKEFSRKFCIHDRSIISFTAICNNFHKIFRKLFEKSKKFAFREKLNCLLYFKDLARLKVKIKDFFVLFLINGEFVFRRDFFRKKTEKQFIRTGNITQSYQ